MQEAIFSGNYMILLWQDEIPSHLPTVLKTLHKLYPNYMKKVSFREGRIPLFYFQDPSLLGQNILM